jgi:hypothetical protein
MDSTISVFLGAMVCMVGALVLGSGLSDLKHLRGLQRLFVSVLVRLIAGMALFAAGVAAIVLKPF